VTLDPDARVSFTADIGRGGFCAQVVLVRRPGTQVRGTIRLEGKELRWAGRVIWAQTGDAYMGLLGRMGIAFTEVDGPLEALLA
jgi:hypothetical protein